jgi:DNA-binding transcriptional LysR family regulator
MRLTHRLVDVFRTVVLTGNLTRTAEQLHTSQPAVSRDLARLEQVLGLVLFDRHGGRLHPTAPALALYEEVQRSFVGLQSIAARAQSLRSLSEGLVDVVALPVLCDTLVPAACEALLARHPGATLRVVAREAPDIERALAGQRHDLGLVEHGDAPAQTQLQPLFEGDEVALLPPSHALAARQRLALADFAGQPFVSFAAEDRYRRRVDALFAERAVERRLVAEASSASSVCMLVQRGLGVAIVNPLTAGFARQLGLRVLPLEVSIPYRVSLVRPTLRPSNALADAFERALANCLREAGSEA